MTSKVPMALNNKKKNKLEKNIEKISSFQKMQDSKKQEEIMSKMQWQMNLQNMINS